MVGFRGRAEGGGPIAFTSVSLGFGVIALAVPSCACVMRLTLGIGGGEQPV